MLTTLQTIILGVVEGVTEFLPISSTGHMILTARLLAIPETDFLKTFEIVIQLGAIMAVVMLYAKRLLINREQLQRLVVAFIPVGVIGLLLYKFAKQYFLGNATIVAWSLLIGGVVLVAFELYQKQRDGQGRELEMLSYNHALLIGVIQSVAIVPGVSRSAATIIGAMLLGYKRSAAVEFSFLLAIPTMLAASGLDLVKSAGSISSDGFMTLALGFVVAFVVAYGSITWLLKYIKDHTFIGFGVYRIVIALIFFAVVSL
jgi:undecaprenyl-diphosphatase